MNKTKDTLSKDAMDLARGAGINFLGMILRAFKSLYVLIITKLFGARVYGLYVLGWSVINILSRIGLFGLDKALLKYVSEYKSKDDKAKAHLVISSAISMGLLISIIISGIIFLASGTLANNIFHKPDLVNVIKILAVAIPFITLSNIFLFSIKALKIMKYDVLVKSILEPLFLFVSAILLFVLGFQNSGIALAHLIFVLGGMIVAYHFFKKIFPKFRYKNIAKDRSLWPQTGKFSIPTTIYDILSFFRASLDILMLGYFVSSSEVGVYGIVVEISFILKKVRQSFEPIFSPIISELFSKGDSNQLGKNFALVARWILTLNLPVFFGVILFGDDILKMIGPEFTIGSTALIILCIGRLISSIFDSTTNILFMSGRPRINLYNTIIILTINIVINLILIPRFGIVGAALGTSISLLIINVILLLEVYILMGIQPIRLKLLQPVFAGILSFSLIFILKRVYFHDDVIKLIIIFILFFTSYFLFAYYLSNEPEDARLIRTIKEKIGST